MYNDPFVIQHKNNYRLLLKIHYQEQVCRNLTKLNIIDAEHDDWRGEIVRWYNKWVTVGYSQNSKQLYLYGDSYLEFKAFIKQIMGNFTYKKILITYLLNFIFRTILLSGVCDVAPIKIFH